MIRLEERDTVYRNKKEKTLVLYKDDIKYSMTLGDIARCGKDIMSCKRLLENVAKLELNELDNNARVLHLHCQKLSRWGFRK